MEIVMALLFAIGVLAIESNTSTSCEEGNIEHSATQTEQAAKEQFVVAPQRPCRYTNGPLVQRDLTVPHPDKGFDLKCQDCRCDKH